MFMIRRVPKAFYRFSEIVFVKIAVILYENQKTILKFTCKHEDTKSYLDLE